MSFCKSHVIEEKVRALRDKVYALRANARASGDAAQSIRLRVYDGPAVKQRFSSIM